MDLNENANYLSTNISFISHLPIINDNNFIPIIHLYERQTKDKNQKQILINQNNLLNNQEDMQDMDDSINEKCKLDEISDNENIKIKDNQNMINKNVKLENNNNILNFDDRAENIIMNNNQFFISSSSNSINKSNKTNHKKENSSDYILQDILININDDIYLNKWKKFLYYIKRKIID